MSKLTAANGGDIMEMIRSNSYLASNYNEISEFCNKNHEPVFITKNGVKDLVILSNEEYARLMAERELDAALAEGFDDIEAGRYQPADEVFAEIERRFGFERI